MLWTNVLLAYDNSQSALRAVEYVGQIFSKVEGAKITLYSVYDKVPSTDMVDTPFTGQVKGRIRTMELDKEKGRMHMEEALKHLLRQGFKEEQVKLIYTERKKSIAKQIIDQVQKGGFGTVVLGRRGQSNIRQMLFGSVSGTVIANLTGATVCVVE